MDGSGSDDCYGKQSNWALIPIDAGRKEKYGK
jgi:hypothetical protein